MSIQEIVSFRTDDGSTFQTRKQAENHEKVLNLAEEIGNLPGLGDVDSDDLIRAAYAIVKNEQIRNQLMNKINVNYVPPFIKG